MRPLYKSLFTDSNTETQQYKHKYKQSENYDQWTLFCGQTLLYFLNEKNSRNDVFFCSLQQENLAYSIIFIGKI